MGPNFGDPVPPGGYVWWYVDALSDDGRYGLSLIAFIGSVFSPYYAWSGRGDPSNHCAVNVAVYRAGGRGWAMTERGRAALWRDATTLAIGPSSLNWENGRLVVHFDEITAPWPSRLRGTVRLNPGPVSRQVFALDEAGRHVWRPIMPRARVEVALSHPGLRWNGDGYFDTNAGTEPLEDAFVAWDWSRAHLRRDTLLAYDIERRRGGPLNLALRAGPDGVLHPIEPQALLALRPTGWRLPRQVRHPGGAPPRLRRTLEDTPFYSRSALEAQVGNEIAGIVHESLSLDRLRSPVVRLMLPFRMPRRAGRGGAG